MTVDSDNEHLNQTSQNDLGDGHGGDDLIHKISHGSHSGQHQEEGEQWLISYADLMTLLVGFFVILLSFSTVDDEKMGELRKAISQEFGGSYEIPFGDLADRIREAMTKMGQGTEFTIKTTDRGVEISFQGTVFFNTGSADMKPEAHDLIQKIIPIVKAEAGDFEVIVEGHTDDVPISNGNHFRNNWELSSIRACRVIDAFENNGFKKSALTALGYGETRPIVPNRDADGTSIPANQSQNRRVVIKLIKQEKTSLGIPTHREGTEVKTPPSNGEEI
jgi:chemotaxis protein MotB